MKCKTCLDHLSQHLDGTLPPERDVEVLDHLGACESCSRELRELKGLLGLLREERDDPSFSTPDDLAAAVLERLNADAVGVVAPASRRPARLLGVAAAIVLAALLGYGASYLRTDELERARDELVGLRAELAGAKGESGLLRESIERSLADVQTSAKTNARLSTELEDERERRRTAEGRLENLREESDRRLAALRSQDDEIRKLRRLVDAAEADVERARGELAEARRRAEQSRLMARARAESPWKAVEASFVERKRPGRAAVEFRRVRGRLEVLVHGTRDEAVPTLLDVARDHGDLELADLALGALEGLLADEVKRVEAIEAARSRDDGGFFDNLSAQFGISEKFEDSNGVAERGTRRRRLRRAEAAWEMISTPSTSNNRRI